MKIQGLVTSEKELFELAKELQQERLKLICSKIKYEDTQKTLLKIQNKTNESDSWEFVK